MPRRPEVDSWFERYDNPMKDVVQRVREIILDADARIDECIKWQAPTFTYQGNLASFYPKSRQHASLMFHVGAKIPGQHPRLEGTGDTSRVMKIGSLEEAETARPELETIVRAWCDWREAQGRDSGAGDGLRRPALVPRNGSCVQQLATTEVAQLVPGQRRAVQRARAYLGTARDHRGPNGGADEDRGDLGGDDGGRFAGGAGRGLHLPGACDGGKDIRLGILG